MSNIKADRPSSSLEIEIVTNGILLKSHWNDIQNIHKNIVRVRVSFDAATEDTYKIIRGGSWDRVIESSEFVNQWLINNPLIHMKTEANFVVQANNYKEMKQFVQLAKQLGFSLVTFQKIVNWNTWPDQIFLQKAIWRKEHPEYQQLVDILQDPVFNGSNVKLGNLTDIK
jgi:molybdenum cofactor biosynthesis enzyme MoaA